MRCPPVDAGSFGTMHVDDARPMDGQDTHSVEQQQQEAECDVIIQNRQGLHARPVMQFVDLASQFASAITVCKGDQMVDGKSPMEMMLLEATCGTPLKLIARGPDARAAVAALAKLIEDRFEEE